MNSSFLSETDNEEKCSIEELLINSCSNVNYTIEKINKKIDNDLIYSYDPKFGSVVIKGEGDSVFQLTTTSEEMDSLLKDNYHSNFLSIIDLGTCGKLLKEENNIDNNISLIIKKFEIKKISAERNVQYEVYNPINKKKLNLSICEKDMVNIYIPVELNDDLLELYKDLQNSGYDLFNINDPFYNDICTPYKSQNKTDVLLNDRKKDFYNNNYTTCQSNCQYSSYNPKNKFLKCECKVIKDDIDVNNFHKFSKEIYKNFYESLKNSNYKVLKCYKLVFNIKIFKVNIGNFIVLTFLIIYHKT